MLENFYKENETPKDDWVLLKNVVLVVAEKDFDVAPWLEHLDLTRYEVAVVWPKTSVNMFAELCAMEAKLVLQIGRRFYKKFPYAIRPEDAAPFKERAVELSPDSYVALHHHDEYSIRDGLGTVDHLIELLKKQRRSFCCVTNHGSVGGWVKQYKACRATGIKPIFGMEGYYSNYRGDDPELRKQHRSANHLILLAHTKEGFDNIIRIHNDAQTEGFYYSPRIDRSALEKWGKGVVGTTACMKGEIPQLLIAGEYDKAKEAYEFYSRVFDEFYIELPMIEYEEQRGVNRLLIQFAREVGAPMMVSGDSHYLERGHDDTHNVLMCIRQHKTVMEQKEGDDTWEFEVGNLFYRNAEQVVELFRDGFVEKGGEKRPGFEDDVFTAEVLAEAMGNTLTFARSAEEIELDSTIKLPRLYDDGKGMLRKKVNMGFRRRKLGSKPNKDAYLERIRREFGVIAKLGWTDYFLICERIIADAKKEFGEWVIGYGRGSAAGSLVSYCLGITDIDPLEHGLLFERFLDEERPDPPDIDNDFDPRYREEVKRHVVELFGEDNVCSIGTYQTYKTRAVVLDVARTLGYDVYEANAVTKKIDPLQAFNDEEGEEHKVDDISFDELFEHYPELKTYLEKYPDVRHHAEILRNQVKNMGTHAGGVIISDKSLKGRIPVLFDKPADKDKRKIVSAWAEAPGKSEELSAVGLVKFDILGLNNLPVVADCVRLVEETKGETLTRDDIPIDDALAIRVGSKEDLLGIFQLENPATKPIADEVGLESLGDVSALTSLIRPGPRDMGMDMTYAHRKHGEPYDMPEFLKKLLADTYGVITFQEQCMQVAQQLAGFSPSQSYKFVKAIAKKVPELMASFKSKFIEGAKPRIEAGELSEKDAEEIWKLLETFAGYGFNRAHATAYSALSTAELWLKYKYPLEFICSLINNTPLGKKKHGQDVFVTYVNYARSKGFDVLSPNVSKSKSRFSIEDGAIRFSISHVKNVASMASVIESFQPFTDMEDFYERVKVEVVSKKTGKKSHRRPTKKVVDSLVAANAFSDFGDRNEVMRQYYELRKKKEEPPQHTDDEWLTLETEMIGLCLSKPPICKVHAELIKKNKWKLISQLDDSKKTMLFCQIEKIKSHTSRAGNSMFMVNVTDGLNVMKFWVFRGAMDYFRDNFKEGYVAAIPLGKFEEGDMRFFDDHRDATIISRGTKLSATKASEEEAESKPKARWRFPHGGHIEFREGTGMKDGTKDAWYVWYESPHLTRITKDFEMLTLLKKLDDMYNQHIYDDVKQIFDAIPAKGSGDTLPEEDVHASIIQMATNYGKNEKLVVVLLAYVYWAMIAEENKENTRLGKRVKMLGIHNVLKDGMSPKDAAKCTFGKSNGYIVNECKKRGF